jgi:peptidoglycan lytic transglycosylase D
MAAVLIFRSGSLKGRQEKLQHDVTRVGRKDDNHIVIKDGVVSSHHAEILRRGGRYFLTDLGATNGTFVNGEAGQEFELRNHDKIEFGEGGPIVEFSCDHESGEGRPVLLPLAGAWEKGMEAIPLEHGLISLGRGLENEIVVGRTHGSEVSSKHAAIHVHSRYCEIEDVGSANGTFVNGKQIHTARLHDGDRVLLGSDSTVFEFQWEGQRSRNGHEPRDEGEEVLAKLDRADKGGRVGDQTRFILQVANKYYRRRRTSLFIIFGIILAVTISVATVLYVIKVRETRRMRALAEDIFYQMRSTEAKLVTQKDLLPAPDFEKLADEKVREQQEYDQFLSKLGVYEGKTPVQQAIMRLARRLGETDLEVPPSFYATTMTYVDRWRSSSRLRNALDLARQQQLPQIIHTALDQYGLPREFFFIPLQESGYDYRAVGPQTNYGIAKGMWQLIPSTARDYNLKIGPLKDVRQYDPSDQRHDKLASTQAAVRYLAYLYSTKAAASGLLVIAAYNYGDSRIVRKLDELPNDPRQRNFWNFYNNHWLPDETRDYVMSIFSAALISERPDLFHVNIEAIQP